MQRPTVDLQRHGLGQVALRHRADHARRLAGGVHQVVDQRVDESIELLQKPLTSPSDARCFTSFLADHAAQPRQLLGHAGVELDHVVEGFGDFPERPVHSAGRRTDPSPFFNAVNAARIKVMSRSTATGRSSSSMVLSPRVVLIVLDRSSKGEAPLVALTAKLSVKAPRSTVRRDGLPRLAATLVL